MNRNYIRDDETPPATVSEWIDQVNRAEPEPIRPEDEPPLPPGWWILPGLLLGALLWVAVFFAGRASVDDSGELHLCEATEVRL